MQPMNTKPSPFPVAPGGMGGDCHAAHHEEDTMTRDCASRQEERKNQILDAAAVVFAEQGFDAARMDDIGQAAGLSKGTVY